MIDRREESGDRKLDEAVLEALYEIVQSSPQEHGWRRPTWTTDMNFEERLEKAIARGAQRRVARGREEEAKELSAEEMRRLFGEARIELSEHIDRGLAKVADHLPGFRYQTVVSDNGWGARISRDDVHSRPGQAPDTVYSRLEVLVRPMGTVPLIEVTAKGTIRNKEALSRKHFQRLSELDLDNFRDQIDLWIFEYAEHYAAE